MTLVKKLHPLRILLIFVGLYLIKSLTIWNQFWRQETVITSLQQTQTQRCIIPSSLFQAYWKYRRTTQWIGRCESQNNLHSNFIFKQYKIERKILVTYEASIDYNYIHAHYSDSISRYFSCYRRVRYSKHFANKEMKKSNTKASNMYIWCISHLYTWWSYYSIYNSQLEDNLKSFRIFTSPGVRSRNIFMWNKKIVFLHTTVPSIGCTGNGVLLLLRLLHGSIKYWACKIAALNIVHTILSHELVGVSRVQYQALAVH